MRLPVTGMAWTTPLGNDLDQVWERLLRGETGIASVPHTVRLRSSLAASVDSVPLTLPPGERMHVLAKSALEAAIASAGVVPADPQVRLVDRREPPLPKRL